jgi:hypothetical protein
MADKSKEKKAEKKIILETSADLYKLPVNIIKTAKIYNYQGKYFEKLYKEALEIESGISQNKQTVIKNQQDSNNQNIQSNNQNRRKIDIRIDRIVFQMKYQTIMGQELGVIGSLNDIGNWDQNKAQKLRWTDGNVWIKDINYQNNIDFEFKFIFIESGKVKTWEDGNNRAFKFNDIKSRLENGNLNGDLVLVNNVAQQNYELDTKTNTLKIICDWNKK